RSGMATTPAQGKEGKEKMAAVIMAAAANVQKDRTTSSDPNGGNTRMAELGGDAWPQLYRHLVQARIVSPAATTI
ncbi:MAG: hypothetical protein Q9199_006173, partial [Rusavskia elegans]